MTRSWVISDTHWGHSKCWEVFKRSDGSPLRPFSSTEEMDETMVANWNSVVEDGDRIYHLGDVVINRKALWILSRLKGRKVLVKGNHDIFKLEDYTPYFDDIRSCVVGKTHKGNQYIMTHIPVHPNQLQGRWVLNVHGHLHANVIDDPRYLNVSVEQINYTPKDLNDIIKDI